MTFEALDFFIDGRPYAKQSFRFTKTGHFYQAKNVKVWQNAIRIKAKEAYQKEPYEGRLSIELIFYVKQDIADVDNLSKAVLDGLQGVIFKNDKKVMSLLAVKIPNKELLGVRIKIHGNV